MKVCSIPGCTRVLQARGWCHTHYEHNRKYGTPYARTVLDRFETSVDRNGPHFADLGRCWIWTGTTTPKGYAQFSVDDRKQYAHRWSYERFVGPIPEGLTVDHLCRRKQCVNPAHLEPVTGAENTRRWAVTVTQCPQGHAYDEANTRINKSNGSRQCRACDRDRWAARNNQLRQKAS